MEFGGSVWLFVVVGGTVLLGIAIAITMSNNRRRSRGEQRLTEAATKQLYKEEDRQS
ncbi:MAG: hypothetical protein JWR75_750 [Devosia sp.]|nr:hypothetical protein [Devosia sp.]